ncbi:hypothetical protein NLJ89_g9818 [Agrocybe chaxingu]|uniref:Uncharacterized protein n=1 Tax=Agrocybe chaxingu TaxID=84603 RepID=A0A9W8MSQ3_9AGAR|nr:hypothetical protein NLJ89_g9818 [Agrocybe chaxingu]
MFAPMSEMSSMAQGFNMDTASMGMMFDAMTPSLSTFGPHASFDMSGVEGTGGLEALTGMDGGFGSSVSMDGSHLHQQQHQQQPHHAHAQHPLQLQQGQQQQQQSMNYGFVDSDTMAMWSAAPTGFELDEWGTYLTNVSELTHSHGPPQHPSGPGMHPHHPGP